MQCISAAPEMKKTWDFLTLVISTDNSYSLNPIKRKNAYLLHSACDNKLLYIV